MKNLLSLLWIATVLLSCDPDTPDPIASAEIQIDGASTTFESISASDVGSGIDIVLKSSTIELAIQLQGKTTGAYTLANATSAMATSLLSVAVLTKSGASAMVSTAGTLTLTVSDGKVSGTLDVDVQGMTGEPSNITGRFSDLKIDDQSSGCLLEKVARTNMEDNFRYDAVGNMTERVTLENGGIIARRLVAHFNDNIVELIDFGTSTSNVRYSIEYSNGKVSKISVFSNGTLSNTRVHEYNTDGRLSKTTTQAPTFTSTRCFSYVGGEISKEDVCNAPNLDQSTVYLEFDTRSSPYALMKKSLQNQEAFIYRFTTFAGYFSPHNVTRYDEANGLLTTVTHSDFNAQDYPVKSVYTPDYAQTFTVVHTYRNCN